MSLPCCVSTEGFVVIFTPGLGVIVTSWRLSLLKVYRTIHSMHMNI